MLSFFVFTFILSFLVLIHEFGHFIIAKRNGVYVEEFGLGIPPRLFGVKFGETLYSINLLPFGGFVRLRGEDLSASANSAALADPRSFASQSPWVKLRILTAGVAMNLLLAVTLFYVLLVSRGFSSSPLPALKPVTLPFGDSQVYTTAVAGFLDGSPLASFSDEVLGDVIITVNDQPVSTVSELRSALATASVPIRLTLLDVASWSPHTIIVPNFMDAPSADGSSKRLGVYLTPLLRVNYVSPTDRAFCGFLHAGNMLYYSVSLFGQLISVALETHSAEPISASVSGPVGIYSVVDSILTDPSSGKYFRLLELSAFLSLSLALMNILPLPALDGGRALFVLPEFWGKKLNSRFESWIHRAGMLFLLGVLAVITLKDVASLFT